MAYSPCSLHLCFWWLTQESQHTRLALGHGLWMLVFCRGWDVWASGQHSQLTPPLLSLGITPHRLVLKSAHRREVARLLWWVSTESGWCHRKLYLTVTYTVLYLIAYDYINMKVSRIFNEKGTRASQETLAFLSTLNGYIWTLRKLSPNYILYKYVKLYSLCRNLSSFKRNKQRTIYLAKFILRQMLYQAHCIKHFTDYKQE